MSHQHALDIAKLNQALHLDDLFYMPQGRMLKLLQLSRELAADLLQRHDDGDVDLEKWDTALSLTEAWIGYTLDE